MIEHLKQVEHIVYQVVDGIQMEEVYQQISILEHEIDGIIVTGIVQVMYQ